MQTDITHSPSLAPRAPQQGLDGLAARSLDELDGLYRAATVSSTLHAADGPLFLGPAMWKGNKGKALALWFALDSRLS